MKYILMMHFSHSDWKAGNMGTWSPEDIKANVEFRKRFHKELVDAGEMVATVGLGGPEGTKTIRTDKDGSPVITDGPFPESKEFLAGYWIVDVDTAERAYEIAARASEMPGQGGAPAHLPIVVRPVLVDRGVEE